jgi:hypothetical protein
MAEPGPTEVETHAKKVLKEVRARSMPGYALQSKTGLDRDKLIPALEFLLEHSLVRVTGELNMEALGDSVISIPLESIGDADIFLGTLKGRTTYR